MGRMILLSLPKLRWGSVHCMTGQWCIRRMYACGVEVSCGDILSNRRSRFSRLQGEGGRDHLAFGHGVELYSRRGKSFGLFQTHLAPKYHGFSSRCSTNGSGSAESWRLLTTNVTVNLSQEIVKLNAPQLEFSDQGAMPSSMAVEQNDEFMDSVPSTDQVQNVDGAIRGEDIFAATLDVSISGNACPESAAITVPGEGEWWHIPDRIDEILPLPLNFEEQTKVLFRSFGHQIESRELLLRVLVHKSYYDLNVPLGIKDREYIKPHGTLIIDSGAVTHQFVQGVPAKTSRTIFLDAHGEVRSQLAILGDAVIGLAVTSQLVHQHSSAGTVTERKCQLVSNSNLSRVWRSLLSPHDDVILCSRDASSGARAQSGMMADSCEAYIGALYTEKGFDTAYKCVSNALLPLLVQADSIRNPVHALNANTSSSFQVLPEYRLIGIDNKGTKHESCRVRVYVKGIRMATGMGVSQKFAREDAARKALDKWSTVFGM